MNNKFPIFLLIILGLCLGVSIYQKNEQKKANLQPPWLQNQDWTPSQQSQQPQELEQKPKTQEIIKTPTSYKEALEVAKKTQKEILLMFHAPWCSWCKKLQKETLTNTAVQAKISKYVIYMLNTDTEPEVVKQYGVSGIPAYKIITFEEKVQLSGSGYKTPSEFIKWLDSK